VSLLRWLRRRSVSCQCRLTSSQKADTDVTIKKRLRAKLKQVKAELRRRRHLPVPDQGLWLASVVRGHLAYYAVPGNIDAAQ